MPVVTFFQMVSHGIRTKGADLAIYARATQLAVGSILGGKKGLQAFEQYLDILQGRRGITVEEVLRRL